MTPARKPAGTTKKAADRKTDVKKTAGKPAVGPKAAKKPTAKKAPPRRVADAPDPALASPADRHRKALSVLAALRQEFPDSRCSLDHGDGWQLLVGSLAQSFYS